MRIRSYLPYLIIVLLWASVFPFPSQVAASSNEAVALPEIDKPKISIDASQKAEPMSVYLYGQFIEHMGRCIYGGIWAEMLEDRKFWYPVGDKMSPWKSVADGTVAMDTETPFVGVHSPVIVLDGENESGIIQEGLALVEGKKYVGYVWLKAAGRVKAKVQVGSKEKTPWTAGMRRLSDRYQKFRFKFTAKHNDPNAALRILCEGEGKLWVGTASVMPADNVEGMRADTLKLLKELNSPIYRWPGGNFVSGYDWRDGVGPRDKRPPRKDEAWKGIEHNDVGIHEFMRFCEIVGTEPYIAVNTGLGDTKNAVDEWEYFCGDRNTPMGKWRAKNGHPEPYKVTWWGLGNEMYGSYQLGYMSLEKYIQKHNEFAKAFYAKDPDLKLVAVGKIGKWSEGMMQHCADNMDLISEHVYFRHIDKPITEHVGQATKAIRRRAEVHRDYRKRFDSLKGKGVRIALDEWNYSFYRKTPDLYGLAGVRYHHRDGMGIAASFNEFARHTDIYYMANYAQTVNVVGCIKTNKTDATFATTGLVLKLYREHFLGTPLETKSTSSGIDAQAMLGEDGKTLVLSVVNMLDTGCEIPLDLKGLRLSGEGKKIEIANDNLMAYNEPGVKNDVVIAETPLSGIKNFLAVKPYSVTLFVLDFPKNDTLKTTIKEVRN